MTSSLRALWRLMAGSRARYAAAIASLVIASSFLYLAPLVPQVVIDGILVGDASDASPMVRWGLEAFGGADFVAAHLWVPALAIAGATGIAGIFTYLRGRWAATATEAITQRLRDHLYDHLQRLPCTYFDGAETGDLVQRCTSDVETLRMFLAEHVVEIGRAVIMLFVPLPLLWLIDPTMTLWSLALVPVIVGFSSLFFVRVRRAFKEADEAEGKLTTNVQENLSGIRVVRAFARQKHECERFAGRNEGYRDLDRRVYTLAAYFWAISDFLCFAQVGVVMVVGLVRMASGDLPVGAFFYFLTAVDMFIFPMRMLGRLVSDSGKATVAFGRLREILDAPAEAQPETPETIEDAQGHIELDGVTFGYRADAPVLHDISLQLRPRQTVAIVGPSGSGKTTLVSLLMRLYDPTEGAIRLDGVDLRALQRSDLRKRLSVVMQEPFLFSKTLGDNLRLGRKDASQQELEHAASTACVHDAIVGFDDGYETKVGERGVTLSGGQRQRVAIARALLQRPSVLVLDDALSAVDTQTESMILTALAKRRGRHTTLIIAHRLSTVALADVVVVLNGGRIVQTGSVEELRTQPGPFARMWAMQNQDSPPTPTAAPPARKTSDV
ncbi:MAG: ABC transporter ATP-binding protein [Myxococcota bacterium]